MQQGASFPNGQAYIDLTDAFVESIADLHPDQQVEILAEVVALCGNPAGNHTLSNRDNQRLAGFNTIDVLSKQYRVVFTSANEEIDGQKVGQIRVLVAGPRRADAVYDTAEALRRSGRFTDEEMQEVWEALALLDVVAEDVGLDGWDYRPEPAPEGLIRAAVASGVLEEEVARNLSKDEVNAAMAEGWGADGPDPGKALNAAVQRARAGIAALDLTRLFLARKEPRCGTVMKRTKQECIRRQGHPGAHRAR